MIAMLKEVAELVAIVAALYALASVVGRRLVRWRAPFHRHRLRILAACSAAVVLVQLSEEVFGRESDAVDRTILLGVHARVPARWDAVFELFTTTASASFIVPAVAAGTILLLVIKRARDAVQLVATTLVASGVVYATKSLVGRTRPALWDTQWYWGSSFPSGHTLTAAAVATCLGLCASRSRMRHRVLALLAAGAWVLAVATSRLVLGVHWPTDVAAAACAGLLVGLAVDAATGWGARRHAAMRAPSAQPSTTQLPRRER